MKVFINTKQIDIPSEASITEILRLQGIERFAGVAVAINNSVVQRNLWDESRIAENDNILIIKATQGG